MRFENINGSQFKLDLKPYQNARELLIAVREAVRDAEYIVKQVQSGQLSEDIKVQQHSMVVDSQKTPVDHMLTTDKGSEHKDAIIERLREDYVLIDTATAILYGHDGCHGIRRSLGNAYADVLWWRYLRYSRWNKVASMMGHSVTWCRRHADIALDTIDAIGFERAAEGMGGLHLHKIQNPYTDEN